MIFWKRTEPTKEAPRSGAEEYAIIEQIYRDEIEGSVRAIPNLLDAGNFGWAGTNFNMMAGTHVELGLLHWRGGVDPRGDFERAVDAFDNLRALVREHNLPPSDYDFPLVYAMLALMGRKTPIEFEDSAYHKEHRWPCYLSCVAHALHDQPLDSHHDQLLNTYLGEEEEFADRIIRTYLNLLEAHSGGKPVDAPVAEAEVNWLKRKTSRFFADGGPFSDGHGLKNELFVDIYLAAILHKVGWDGGSIHRWKW
jgi:hypothetical protein